MSGLHRVHWSRRVDPDGLRLNDPLIKGLTDLANQTLDSQESVVKVNVPAVIKQKFGPKARIAYLRTTKNPTQPETVRGIAQVNGEITIPGVKVISLTAGYATIELDASLLEQLANDNALTYFDCADPMGI